MVCAANKTWFSSQAMASHTQPSLLLSTIPRQTKGSDLPASPCLNALAQRAMCRAANQRALEIMGASRLNAVTVVQDVRTGAVVAVAASQPQNLDVTTLISPLSLSKLSLAASWWDNRQPDTSFESTKGTPNADNPAYRSRVSVHEMLVGGSDSAGRQMAVALRRSVGTKTVLEDFRRYGFVQPVTSPLDNTFWSELPPAWQTRMIPPPAHIALSDKMNDMEWAEALSLGETNMQVTTLHVSRFLQAVGNNGLMLTPILIEEQSESSVIKTPADPSRLKHSTRVMRESTALRLQSAMRDTVQRGTAKSVAKALDGTGWHIGGKTGSGTAALPKGSQVDGWFAGLLFDPQGKARFTVATFVRSGGYGGENAAKISAELARYILGAKSGLGR